MAAAQRLLRELWNDSGGVTTVEYALLLALLVVAVLGAFRGLGRTVADVLVRASTAQMEEGAGN